MPRSGQVKPLTEWAASLESARAARAARAAHAAAPTAAASVPRAYSQAAPVPQHAYAHAAASAHPQGQEHGQAKVSAYAQEQAYVQASAPAHASEQAYTPAAMASAHGQEYMRAGALAYAQQQANAPVSAPAHAHGHTYPQTGAPAYEQQQTYAFAHPYSHTHEHACPQAGVLAYVQQQQAYAPAGTPTHAYPQAHMPAAAPSYTQEQACMQAGAAAHTHERYVPEAAQAATSATGARMSVLPAAAAQASPAPWGQKGGDDDDSDGHGRPNSPPRPRKVPPWRASSCEIEPPSASAASAASADSLPGRQLQWADILAPVNLAGSPQRRPRQLGGAAVAAPMASSCGYEAGMRHEQPRKPLTAWAASLHAVQASRGIGRGGKPVAESQLSERTLEAEAGGVAAQQQAVVWGQAQQSRPTEWARQLADKGGSGAQAMADRALPAVAAAPPRAKQVQYAAVAPPVWGQSMPKKDTEWARSLNGAAAEAAVAPRALGGMPAPHRVSVREFLDGAPMTKPLLPELSTSSGPGAAAPTAPGHRHSKAKVQNMYLAHEHTATENYIPYLYNEIRDMIVENHADVFAAGDNRRKFFWLCKWFTLRNSARLNYIFSDIYDLYDRLDPDVDDDTCDAAGFESYMKQFRPLFRVLLGRANFERLTEEKVQEAYEESNATVGGRFGQGVSVKPVDPNIIEYRIFYREQHTEEVEYSSWRTLWMTRVAHVQMFERMVIVYRRRPQEHIDYLQAQNPPNSFMVWFKGVFNWVFNIQRLSPDTLEPGNLYIRYFKDVASCDIDMLLPGAEPKFSWIDYILIWGSLIVALVAAIYKAATGTLNFSTPTNIATSTVLVIMPIVALIKGYSSVKNTLMDLHLYLANLYATHNLSTNQACISQVLVDAQGQEDREVLLAYFFMWRGQDQPRPMSKGELDRTVERFISDQLAADGIAMKIDFEVDDAVDKLVRMGIATEVDGGKCGAEEDKMYVVHGLDDAVELAHVRHFAEAKEVYGVRPRRKHNYNGAADDQDESVVASGGFGGGALGDPDDGPVWQEVMGRVPATGQKYRYYWNTATGESSYTPPEGEPYVPLPEEQLPAAPAAAEQGARSAAGAAWQECVGVKDDTGQKYRYFWNRETGESAYALPPGAAFAPLAGGAGGAAGKASPDQPAARDTNGAQPLAATPPPEPSRPQAAAPAPRPPRVSSNGPPWKVKAKDSGLKL